jgi:hypothetical protein
MIIRGITERMEFLCTDAIMIMMKKKDTLKEFSHFCCLKGPQSYFSLKNANSKYRKAKRELEG